MKSIFKNNPGVQRYFPILIFIYALILVIDGLTFLVLATERNPSLLTPLFFGGIIFLMGLMSLKKDLKIFGRHGASALSVIAFASSVSDLSDLLSNFPRQVTSVNLSNSIMAVVSILFLIQAVKQFAKERGDSSEEDTNPEP